MPCGARAFCGVLSHLLEKSSAAGSNPLMRWSSGPTLGPTNLSLCRNRRCCPSRQRLRLGAGRTGRESEAEQCVLCVEPKLVRAPTRLLCLGADRRRLFLARLWLSQAPYSFAGMSAHSGGGSAAVTKELSVQSPVFRKGLWVSDKTLFRSSVRWRRSAASPNRPLPSAEL